MIDIHIDIESQSRADLPKVGVHKYAEDLSTKITQVCYAIGNDPVRRWDNPTVQIMPYDLREALNRNEKRLIAHNAMFERVMLGDHPGQSIGFPATRIEDWYCTMAACSYKGLPKTLEKAAEALQLPVRKDKEGKKAMMKIAKPRKPTANDSSEFHTWIRYPELFEAQAQYCAMDVEVERAIHHKIGFLPIAEQNVFWLDQKINDRGVAIDIGFVQKICSILTHKYRELQAEARVISGYEVSQVEEIMNWSNARGAGLDDLRKESVSQVLKQKNLDPEVRRVLEIRQSASKMTSGSKFFTALRAVCMNGRVKGMFRYHFASTGRWAGAILQPHNFPNAGYDDDYVPDVMSIDLEPVRECEEDLIWE